MSKRIVITGANTGIGYATAERLVMAGADVVLACRNPVKAEAAQARLKALGGVGTVDLVTLDLNSLTSVKAAAAEIKQRYGTIDVLINNAGIFGEELHATADGYEQQFGVNYLGPFLLTQLLLPSLEQAAAGRIINLASIMHWLGRMNPDSFRKTTGFYNAVGAYGQSKLGNLLFSKALARRLKAQGSKVTSNALHPGGVDSEIYRDLPKYQYAVMKPFLIATDRPAKLISEMALDEAWAGRSGDYVSAHMPAWQSSKAKNDRLGDTLYAHSLEMVKAYMA